MKKILIISSHPVPYHVSLYRGLSGVTNIDLEVIYLRNVFADGLDDDVKKGWTPSYSRDLLTGYKSSIIANYPLCKTGFLSVINPSIINVIGSTSANIIVVLGYGRLTLASVLLYGLISNKKIVFKGETENPSNHIPIIKRWFLNIIFKGVSGFVYSYKRNKEFIEKFTSTRCLSEFTPCSVDNEYLLSFRKKMSLEHPRDKNALDDRDGDEFRILFVGRLIERKDPFTLLKAFQLILKQGTRRVKLLIAGDGPLKNTMVAWTKQLNLNDKIQFLGFVGSDKMFDKVYKTCDVLVLPSISDPSPKCINEAMNFGVVPVVSDSVGTADDLVLDSGAGLVFKTGDELDLLSKLLFLLNEKNLLIQKKDRSIEVVNRWSPNENIDGFVSLFASLDNE